MTATMPMLRTRMNSLPGSALEELLIVGCEIRQLFGCSIAGGRLLYRCEGQISWWPPWPSDNVYRLSTMVASRRDHV